ncbi:fatty acid synthase subunit beta [Diutina catenulata]
MVSATHRPFSLAHGDIEHTFLVPVDQFFKYSQLRERFIKQLPTPTEGYAEDDEPSSPAELFGQFLGFVAQEVDAQQEGQFDDLLRVCVADFDSRYLATNDIHSFAVDLTASEEFPTTGYKVKFHVIRNYLTAVHNSNSKISCKESQLLKDADAGKAKLSAIFGGQGNTDEYFEELRELYQVYRPLVFDDVIVPIARHLKQLIGSDPAFAKIYTQGLDVVAWLNSRELTPDVEYLLAGPVSCPLISLIQMCHYTVTAKVLGITPGQLRQRLASGTTGHSQGLIAAMAIASSDSWSEFIDNASKCCAMMLLIGSRSLLAYPKSNLPPTMLQDSMENGEGRPSPMLSVSNLTLDQVTKFIDETNKNLPKAKHISISLVNGGRNMVLSGPPESLYGFNLILRNNKAASGLDQSRVPYSQRKLKFSNRFLPIHSPFHSHMLASATDAIYEDCKTHSILFDQKKATIPVYDSESGENYQDYTGDLTLRLIECITTLPVMWERATDFESTHMLEFGPGGVSGLGVLTHRNKSGTGTRVILAGTLDVPTAEDDYGFKQEIFNYYHVKYAPDWLQEFAPRLVRTKGGKVYVDTKFSRLLGRAPLMVPGMTPTTVNPDLVIATTNAGYHIELGGGGYFMPSMLTEAIDKIVAGLKPGFGFSVNMLYVAPRMLQWGIPLIRELREKGYPIEGLVIGAGVPSLEVAAEYIETLGITQLGLKPGSIDAISQCIAIAKAHPNFPIIVQWTGGRGGGHHSYEDFHQPILQMYSKLRKCKNIILIAGSGFGSEEDTYPYLTGAWTKDFKYPPMPFDGVLLGSRVMTAKEAATSLPAKKAIAATKGVTDASWEQSFKKDTGGIVTVISEMGEPIHKIATRGVLLWKEFDETLFSLPKAKMVEALAKKKDYIIGRLNKDFQKPWFGQNAAGVACDLEDMTYQEVANRMLELMYIKKHDRWIDFTLRNFVGDFLRRVEERFTTTPGEVSRLQSFNDLESNPQQVVDAFFKHYPAAKEQLISEEDADYFLICCIRPGQKPAPFVPILDERFEVYFKKDSLWQSEDIESVVDEDVGRVCILHGPVAAQFTNTVDEPIKDILDSIHDGHIAKLVKDVYAGDESKIPTVEYFGGNRPVDPSPKLAGVEISTDGDVTTYKVSRTAPVDTADFLATLAGPKQSWLQAVISTERVVQGKSHVPNPLKDILTPAAGAVFQVSPSKLTVLEKVKGEYKPTVSLFLKEANTIELDLIEHRTADGDALALPFLYTYNPADGFAPILEVMEGRNDRIKRFYWALWYGSATPYDTNIDVEKVIDGDFVTVSPREIADFTHAIGNKCEAFIALPGRTQQAPMDFAIVIGWRAIIKAIFPATVDGDLLKLVHLSNGYRMLPGATPLRVGDKVKATAEIQAVLNQPSGKMVEVVGTISREDGGAVMEVTSQFLYRGQYTDFENTFQKVTETPYLVSFASAKDIAVLRSKEWFSLEKDVDLLGQDLTFRCNSVYKFKRLNVYSSIVTSGDVFLELPTKEVIKVGSIDYEAGLSYGNPVIDYLSRNGSTIEEAVKFDNVIPISSGEELTSKAPGTNEPYAVVSGDYNPIHVSRVFASYAKLPGTITHGMFSSAAVRGLVEEWAANSIAARVRAFKCSFVGMVLPNDTLQTTLEHIGMINGRKIIKVETKNVESDSVVLVGEAEIEQPITTYVFTGQGSQEQGMGMDLYKSSPVAAAIWDKADRHFVDNYGFSILDIVQNNPKELTVHFGGAKGRKIRDNYVSMMFETIGDDGELKSEKIFKDINHTTDSYTFVSPTGLLSATQFTQPALTLMEKAAFEDIKSKGLIPSDIMFAGHSLGEYSALSSLANVMPIESLVDVVFYRGMTMQVAVPRDSLGRSNYGMCAVNPSRVSPTFDDAALRFVVDQVASVTGWLLEIVNYNVENQQYVAAGDLRGLDCVTNVLNVIKLNKVDIVKLQEQMSVEDVAAHLKEIIDEVAKQTAAKQQPIDLQRGFAVIPLKGIDVPFHSSYLMSGVKPFERFLRKKIPKSSVNPHDLINKYIPNVTAKPFKITKEYFEQAYELTKSEKLKAILENWESYEKA